MNKISVENINNKTLQFNKKLVITIVKEVRN